VSVLLAVLAALGVGRLGRQRRGVRLAAWVVGGLVAGYLACAAVAALLPGAFKTALAAFSINLSPETAAERLGLAQKALSRPLPFLLEAGLGLATVAVIALLARGRGRIRRDRSVAGGALVGCAAVSLALLSPPANSVQAASAFDYGDTPFVRLVQATDAHRLLTLGEPGWYEGMPDQLAAARVPDLRMFSSLNLLASDDLVAALHDDPARESLRRAVGVDVVVAFGDQACPTAAIASLDQLKATACRLPALRPPYWLSAEAATREQGSSGSATSPVEATVDLDRALADAREATIAAWDPAGGRFSVDAPAAGWVWIDRAWWPGWHVEVDGQAVTPLRALAGQLVPVTAGQHEIVETLVPWEALVGVGLGFGALLVAAGWLLWSRRRRPG
jgi:hypothetical protein